MKVIKTDLDIRSERQEQGRMNELEKSPEGAAVSQETDKETKKRLKAEAKEKKAQEKREAKMAGSSAGKKKKQ